MSSHGAEDNVVKALITKIRSVIDRDAADAPSADQFTTEHASHVPWADDAPIVREDERYTPPPDDSVILAFGRRSLDDG